LNTCFPSLSVERRLSLAYVVRSGIRLEELGQVLRQRLDPVQGAPALVGSQLSREDRAKFIRVPQLQRLDVVTQNIRSMIDNK
jgi:hypothetical protein